MCQILQILIQRAVYGKKVYTKLNSKKLIRSWGPAASWRRQRSWRALWDNKKPSYYRWQTIIAWGCAAFRAWPVLTGISMTKAVFWVLLHEDSLQDVMSHSESPEWESEAYLSIVWLGHAYGGLCLVRDEVAESALLTFGLNQRFSKFYIRVHWGKSPPHLADVLEAWWDHLHHIIVFVSHDSPWACTTQHITPPRSPLAISA